MRIHNPKTLFTANWHKSLSSIIMVLTAIVIVVGNLGPKYGFDPLSIGLVGFTCLFAVLAIWGHLPGLSVGHIVNRRLDRDKLADMPLVEPLYYARAKPRKSARIIKMPNLPDAGVLANRMARQAGQFKQDNRGAATYLSMAVIFMVAMVLALPLLNTGARQTRQMMQQTTDAAAIAAIAVLPDVFSARASARRILKSNLSGQTEGPVVITRKIEIGQWNPITGRFTVSTANPNAARVTVRQSKIRTQATLTMVRAVFGVSERDIEAQSIFYLQMPVPAVM